jgi:hypothetical protein
MMELYLITPKSNFSDVFKPEKSLICLCFMLLCTYLRTSCRHSDIDSIERSHEYHCAGTAREISSRHSHSSKVVETPVTIPPSKQRTQGWHVDKVQVARPSGKVDLAPTSFAVAKHFVHGAGCFGIDWGRCDGANAHNSTMSTSMAEQQQPQQQYDNLKIERWNSTLKNIQKVLE